MVEALCLEDAVYDLIIGNVPGAREANSPDLGWVEASVATTRLQAKTRMETTPLPAFLSAEWLKVDKKELMKLQREDKSIEKLWNANTTQVTGEREAVLQRNQVYCIDCLNILKSTEAQYCDRW